MPRTAAKLTGFGKCLRKLRVDYDIYQTELASRLGCSAAYLSGIEAGKKPPSDKLIDRISARMGLSAIERTQLRNAADSEVRHVTIDLTGKSPEIRAAMVALARAMPAASEADVAVLAFEIYGAAGG